MKMNLSKAYWRQEHISQDSVRDHLINTNTQILYYHHHFYTRIYTHIQKDKKRVSCAVKLNYKYQLQDYRITTAIHAEKYRNPSDLRSQASDGPVSTMVGDHMGILGAVVFVLLLFLSLERIKTTFCSNEMINENLIMKKQQH